MIMCWCVVAARADYPCLSLWGWTNSLILLAHAEANFDFKGGGGNRTSQFWKWIWKLCLVNLDALLFRALSLKKWEVEWSLKVFSFHIHLLRNWGMSSQDKTSKWGLWGWVQLWFPKHLYPTGKLSDKKAKQFLLPKVQILYLKGASSRFLKAADQSMALCREYNTLHMCPNEAAPLWQQQHGSVQACASQWARSPRRSSSLNKQLSAGSCSLGRLLVGKLSVKSGIEL